MKHLYLFSTLLIFCSNIVSAQNSTLRGTIIAEGQSLELATIGLVGTSYGTSTDTLGLFKIKNIPAGSYKIVVSSLGYSKFEKNILLKSNETAVLDIDLSNYKTLTNEVVITGTLKEVMRSESPVPVEIYTPTFFKKNPTPNIYEALQNVNGVRPQLNCNVCNTGDIHINGLEGPYTMVLIDGMPIVSSLSTVYGLSGIPNSLVERIEVVKGPASSLYGSEAVGGLINIITKTPMNAPLFSADMYTTSWQEYNTDLALKINVGKNSKVLTGLNYFNYNTIKDENHDNFTDVTLQKRISGFQKWTISRKNNRQLSLAGRIMKEDRWGGDVRWETKYRGGDSIYGESIYTDRYELIGNYQLPTKEKMMLSFSFNDHEQDSRYGNTSYIASQKISFGQLTWDKKIGRNDMLLGTALRHTFYDDNTPATASEDNINKPQSTYLPGIFVQDEIKITDKQKLLLGIRYDYNSIHGSIFTPRIAYKYSPNFKNIFRLNAGTGYRVVNLFTEDHAALTGARSVEIKNELNPEKSYNANINYIRKVFFENNTLINLDATVFYTYFNNRIVADFESNPNKIFYDNINGYAISKGISLNIDAALANGLKIIGGATYMENTLTKDGTTIQQLLTEKFTGTWAISYKIPKTKLSLDYTGNVYSPMRLPLLSALDPRPQFSPWWSIQNIQMVYTHSSKIEIYGGVKNLLNWTPAKRNKMIITRTNDPFDKQVSYDANGQVVPTANNPFGLTFDPNYVYAPNQGLRIFLGMRLRF